MKKLFAILFIVATLVGSKGHAQKQYGTGLRFDDDSYASFPRKAGQEKLGTLPQSINYEKYAPSVVNQGLFATCVGFSSGYYFRTMVDAIQRKTTSQATINQWCYSPSYLYNRIKDANDPNCQYGSSLFKAFETMKSEGIATLAQLGYPNCGINTTIKVASTSRISDMSAIFNITDAFKVKVMAAQKALVDGFPIVIGMRCPPSFEMVQEVWTPTANEKANVSSILDGHAMCVVGYDDLKYGGAFRVLNSWGTQWGQNGFGWIRYEDFGLFVKYGFEGFPLPEVAPVPSQVTLAGEVSFQLLGGDAVPVSRNFVAKGTGIDNDPTTTDAMVAYQLTNPYNSGTRFKFGVKVSKQAYVYIISSDLSNNVNDLFPFSDSVSAVIAANNQIMLPSSVKNYKLDQNIGTDYWLFLYSEKSLDVIALKNQLKSASGSFFDRIMAVLGSELVEPNKIKYFNDRVGFDVFGKPKGSIVPLLISLTHR